MRCGAGDRFASSGRGERCAAVLGGVVEATAGGVSLGAVGGRDDVFDELGEAVYVPADVELVLTADAPAVVALAAAPLDGRAPGQARVIAGAGQRVADAGKDNWSRTIRTILGPGDDAGRLIVGETVNPPGNWSSYPPHKHDRQEPPGGGRARRGLCSNTTSRQPHMEAPAESRSWWTRPTSPERWS